METNLLNHPITWKDAEERLYTDTDLHYPSKIRLQPERAIPPSIHAILDAYGAFPPYSLVVGLCRDGLPFMLSLDNPKSGSILVVGEPGSGKTQLINVVSTSASLLNNPQNLSYIVISSKTNEYVGLMKFPHCQAFIAPYDRSAGEMVIELASIAEQRRAGRERGSMMMLIIDDFHSLSHILSDYSVYLNLKSLVLRGPQYGIWPIISINPNDVQEEKGQFLRSFGTYIFEKTTIGMQSTYGSDHSIIPDAMHQPNFDVIIGGRLTPIINLTV